MRDFILDTYVDIVIARAAEAEKHVAARGFAYKSVVIVDINVKFHLIGISYIGFGKSAYKVVTAVRAAPPVGVIGF